MILSVLLWVFLVEVLSVQSYEDFKHPDGHICDNNTSTHSELAYLRTMVCQSGCRPRETLVEVWHEFPEEIHHTISPCYVPLQRCGGYCSNEATVCEPVKNYTVLVQVMRSSNTGDVFVVLPFVEHSSCICRSRESLTEPFV